MDEKTYRKKVLGCWLGKAVGGTLGAPIEGWDGPHHLEFYDPVPTTMVPNDDLDLQVVWAMTIAAQPKPVVNSQILAEAWLKNVGFPWDEYAVAIRNLKNGIRPPFHGLRPGRLSKVFRPMTTTFPMVSWRKNCWSAGMVTSIWPRLPMAQLRSTAAIICIRLPPPGTGGSGSLTCWPH